MIARFRFFVAAAAIAVTGFLVSSAEDDVRLAIERPFPVFHVDGSEDAPVPFAVALESDPRHGRVREFAVGLFLAVGERPEGSGMLVLDHLVLEDDETFPPPGEDTLRRRWEVTPDRDRLIEVCRRVRGARGEPETQVHLHAGALVRVDRGGGFLEARRLGADATARVVCDPVD